MYSVQCVVSVLRDLNTSSIWILWGGGGAEPCILWGTTKRGCHSADLDLDPTDIGPPAVATKCCHDLGPPKLNFQISFNSSHLCLNMEIFVFSGKMFKTSPVVYIKL